MAQKRIGPSNAQRRRRPPAQGRGAGGGAKGDDLDGLYVDDLPVGNRSKAQPPAPPPAEPGRQKRGGRAAERRRARGEAPVELEGGPTRTSLKRDNFDQDDELLPVADETSISRRRRRGPSEPKGRVDTSRVSMPAGTLRCVKGPEEGLELQLIEGEYTIGRGRDNNFVLKDIAASRQHLRLVVDGSAVLAVDLGSGNGTRVNGSRITTHALRTGDRVEIGNSVLEFKSAFPDNTAQVDGYADRTAPVPSEVEATAPPAAPMSDEPSFVPSDYTAPPPVDMEPAMDQVLEAAAKLSAELGSKPAGGVDEDLPRTGNSRTRTSNPTQRVPAMESSLGTLGPNGGGKKGISAHVPEDLWADGETATRMPNMAELFGPEKAAQLQGAPPPRRGAPAVATPQGVRRKPKEGRGLVIGLGVVMVLLLVVAAGLGYWYVNAEKKPEVAAVDEVTPLLERSKAALEAKDYAGARTYAEEALRLRPDDSTALLLLEQAIRGPVENATPPDVNKPTDEKLVETPPATGDVPGAGGDQKLVDGKPTDGTPSEPGAVGTGDTKVAAKDEKVATPKDTAVAAKTAPPDDTKSGGDATKTSDTKAVKDTKVATAEPTNAKTSKVSSKKVSTKSSTKKKTSKVSKKSARTTPKKRARSTKMSEADAESSFRRAIKLFRSDDYETACGLLQKVSSDAPAGSTWKVKAKSALRRCE